MIDRDHLSDFEGLRSRVTDADREIIDAVWKPYLATGQWPLAREIHRRFGKPEARGRLERLGGGVVWEDSPYSDPRYQVTPAGTLLTSDGPQIEELLERYLEYVRDRFLAEADFEGVRSDEVQAALGLDDRASLLLGRMVLFGSFFAKSAGGGGVTWSASIPHDVDDLPTVPDIREHALRWLTRDYVPGLPLDGTQRSSALYRRNWQRLTVASHPPVGENAAAEVPLASQPPLNSERIDRPDPAGTGERHPRTFVSYSHDSDAHKARVRALAERLRREGVDCRIDQYVRFAPAEGWPAWMARELRDADSVLVVATETYARRFNGDEAPGKGHGARWEGAIITQELYEGAGMNTRFIPVVFDAADAVHIPTPIRATTRYVLDGDYDDLYRHLTDQPAVVPPPLGSIRVLGMTEEAPPVPAASGDRVSIASPLQIVFAPSEKQPTSYHQVWVRDGAPDAELFRVGVLNGGDVDIDDVRVLLTAFAPQGSQNLPLALHLMHDNDAAMSASRQGFRLSPSAEPRRFVDVAMKAYGRRTWPHALLDHLYLQHAEPGVPSAIPDGRYDLTLVVEGRGVRESSPYTFTAWVGEYGRLRFAPVGDLSVPSPQAASPPPSDPLVPVIEAARAEARSLGHGGVGGGHLLLGLLAAGDPFTNEILRKFGAHFDRDAARASLRDRHSSATRAPARPRLLPRAGTLIETARAEAQRLGHGSVRPAHLLIALAATPEFKAALLPPPLAPDDLRSIVAQASATEDW